MKKNNARLIWYARAALILIVVAGLVAWWRIPAVNAFIQHSLAAFSALDQHAIERFIHAYGPQAALVSFALMILQAVVAPLPAFLITFANASLFGAFWGGALSWVSAMAGAALCFFIARVLGREAVEKLTGKTVLRSMDAFFDRYGHQTVLICRLLPFVPFDPISYAAGLTAMDFGGFMLATGLGQLPACIVYSYVGGMLTGGAQKLFIGLLCLFALAILVTLIRQVWVAKHKEV